MSHDPVEYVGTDHTQRADHVPSKRKAAPPPVALAKELAAPEPAKTGSHPKHAIERPRKEYEAAQQEVHDAQSELSAAKLALTDAEIAETQALIHWLELQPKPDADQLLRDYGARQAEQRAANVAAGFPPEGVKPVAHNQSGIDTAAANRARQSAQAASTPLRNPTARRLV